MRKRTRPTQRRTSVPSSKNTRRSGRPTLGQTFKNATKRAKQRSNRKIARPTLALAFSNPNRRKDRKNRRMARHHGLSALAAAVSGTMEDDAIYLNLPQRLIRWVLALILLPICVITTVALFNVTDAVTGSTQNYWIDLIKTPHFFYFAIGTLLMGTWFFSGVGQHRFLYLYVLGHELTHAFFVYLSLGKVSDISISSDGGYIMTNKSNILIALSPYFIPFWSIVVLILSTILSHYTHYTYHSHFLYACIGATWTFHLLWTLWMIPRDQPDLQENGYFFSLVLIYLINVIILSAILCLAPGNLSWHHWANQFLDAGAYVQALAIHLMNASF